MKELKRFQGSTFDEFLRRRLIEDRDTILELTARIQELQNEVNCMNDSRDFKDAEPVRSGLSHVTSQPVSFPPLIVILAECKAVLWECRAATIGPPDFWDTHRISGNVFFCKSNGVFSHLIQEGSIRGFPTCQNIHNRLY